MNEAPQPSSSMQAGPHHGPFLVLGLPFALEVATLYFLITVETPLTPLVGRLQESAFGLFVLACFGLLVVCAVMPIVLTIAERRRRRRRDQDDASAV